MSLTTVVLSFGGIVAPKIFPIGRIMKVVQCGFKAANTTNPLISAVNVTLTVVECCSPPPVRLAVVCIAAGASAISTVVSPNPYSLGATAHFMAEIYDNC